MSAPTRAVSVSATAALVPLMAVTFRALLSRRRTVLLVLLAGLPVLVAIVTRLGGGRLDEATILDTLVVRSVLPLTALVLATAALGAELEDGTAVTVLTKPLPRWLVVVAKLGVAVLLTAALVVASTIVTGLIGGRDGPNLGLTLAVAAAVIVGSAVYGAAFIAASVITTRALIIGLAYTLIWEGVLAGVLEGTRIFSVREAVLGIAAALAPDRSFEGGLDPTGAAVLAGVVFFGGVALATARLARYEVHGGD